MSFLRLFIGFDSRETIAYHVLSHSILRRASRPISITPLALNHLQGWLFTRVRDPQQSTSFSYTRFLVPYLSGFQGISVYLDCDMLCLTDINELIGEIDDGPGSDFAKRRYPPTWAVKVCQHHYTPKQATKFLGHTQTTYERKNWSSFIVWNNARCCALTPEYVNRASGLELHRFTWLKDEEIGTLPLEWNHLVGEENQVGPPKIVHYTNGTPCFPEYRQCSYAEEWFAERDHMLETPHEY